MDISLDDVIHFDVITSNPTTGAAVDADSTPTFAIYEEATDTAIVTGDFTKRTSLTGNYRGTVTLSAANGFEVGKWYNVIASATVGAVAGKAVVMRFAVVAAPGTTGGLSLHDTVSAVKTKTDFLPSATAGTTGGVATEPVEATLSAGDITSIASQISSNLTDVDVQLVDAVTAVSKLTLTQGTDYYDADGKAVAWTFVNRSYTPTSCKLTVCSGNVKTWTTTPVETSGSGSTSFHAEFDIDRATADELEAGDGTFEVISVLANGREIAEISEGVARIKRRLTP